MRLQSAVTPIALVVMAAGTAGYAYFVDQGRVSDADREARRRDVFPSFRVEQVRSVELVHGTEMTLLERDASGGTWSMRSPRAGATDAAAVDSLLRELEMATREREVREADAIGLEQPRVRGRITVGRLDYRFEIGADAPQPEGAAYMRLDGEGTFVIGRSLKVQLLRGADAYRDRTLVPFGTSDVGRLEVRGPDGGYVVVRSSASFRIGSTHGLRVARAAADHLLSALADARADVFVEDADADRTAASPQLTVVVTPAGQGAQPVTLLLGGTCPKEASDVVAVRTQPSRTSACVAKHVLQGLAVSADGLVDRAPFFAHADEMAEIRLEPVGAGAPRVEIARRGNGWHERAPQDRDLAAEEVDSANVLALALASGQAISVRAPGPGASFTARWRATVERTGGAPPEVVELAAADPDDDGRTLARRADDGAILLLDRVVARRLEPHPVALRSLAAVRPAFDPGSITAIDDSCTDAPEKLELRDGTWRAQAATGRAGASAVAIDGVTVADMLQALSHAKADAWIAETDDGTFGFRAGSCTVMLTAGGAGGRQAGVVFGAAAPRGSADVYAHDLGDPAVFLAPAVLREIVSHPALDRDSFRLDSRALTRVTLARGGAKLVLDRAASPDGGLVRAGGGAELAARDGKLEVALLGLYAQCALHTGPPVPAEGLDRPMLEIDAIGSASDGGAPFETRIAFGAPTHQAVGDGYFARASGVDATFLVPRKLVNDILDAW